MFEQSNVVTSIAIESIPQASLDPLSICAAVIIAEPVASNWTVNGWHIATGATLSSTVTIEEHVDTFPLMSVTVNITVLAPMFEQSNVLISIVIESIPHASLEPLSICVAVIVANPCASNETVNGWHTATGAILSSTVTIDVHVDTFPLISVTVNVTVFGPTFEQSNVVTSIAIKSIPQASLEPLSICVAVIVADPSASNWTVNGWHKAIGASLSTTVTSNKHVLELPWISVTNTSTVVVPTENI